MCYVCKASNDKEAMERERTAEEWINLAKEAKEAGMLYLLLTGGEVFLHKDFKRIYDEVAIMGFSISIFTNATMITPEIAKWLGKTPPSMVEVTMYGASPETYLKVCGYADAYNRAVRGIELLIAEGISLRIKMTVIHDNIKDFNEIAEFAQKHKVEFEYIDYIFPRREGYGTYPEFERLSPQEIIEFETYVKNYYKESELFKTEKLPINNTKEQFNKFITAQHDEDPFECLAGKCSFWVTWDGKMTACGDINEPASYPFEKSVLQGMEGNE